MKINSLFYFSCCIKLLDFLKVIAENLSEEEIKGLKQMFNNMDTDGSGTITYEELKTGLSKLGSKLSEAEIQQLMEAVSRFSFILFFKLEFYQDNKFESCTSARLLKAFSTIRLMLITMGLSTILNLLLLQCIGIGLTRMKICTRHFSILIRITVG